MCGINRLFLCAVVVLVCSQVSACCESVLEKGRPPNQMEIRAMQAAMGAFDQHPDFELTSHCVDFMHQVRFHIQTLEQIQKRNPGAVAYYADGVCSEGVNIVYPPDLGDYAPVILVHESIHVLQACNGLDGNHKDVRLWSGAEGSVLYAGIQKYSGLQPCGRCDDPWE